MASGQIHFKSNANSLGLQLLHQSINSFPMVGWITVWHTNNFLMTSEADLESLISSTLRAIDVTKEGASTEEPIDSLINELLPETNEALASNETEVDDVLTKLKSAAPKLADSTVPGEALGDGFEKMLESLLTPESILESMEDLSVEMEKYLADKTDDSSDSTKYRRQLAIYKQVSCAYESNAGILDESSEQAAAIKLLLEELQGLGSPPPEVVEKLMANQFGGEGSDEEDLGKEFKQFLKEAGNGGLLPGLTREDEEIIRQLTQDPNALKNLLGGGNKPPGDCSVM